MRTVSAFIVSAFLVGPATASDKGPSAEETAAYITAKLKNCGTFMPEEEDRQVQVRAAIDGHNVTISSSSTKFGSGSQSTSISEFNIREISNLMYSSGSEDVVADVA